MTAPTAPSMTAAELLIALSERDASIQSCKCIEGFWTVSFTAKGLARPYKVGAADPEEAIHLGLRLLDVALGGVAEASA